jgi:hypothetical protein
VDTQKTFRKNRHPFSSPRESQITHPMKTILLILTTLIISQFLYVEYGPQNPVARLSSAAAGSVRWLLHSAFHVVE